MGECQAECPFSQQERASQGSTRAQMGNSPVGVSSPWGRKETPEKAHTSSVRANIPPGQGSCELWHQPGTSGRVPGGLSSWHSDDILSQVLSFHSWRSAVHKQNITEKEMK